MLQLKNITITHKKDLREIVREFSFVLREGDKAVLIGEEGNGKSTLLKLIQDEEMVEHYVQWSGEIIKNRLHTGYLAQELAPEQKQRFVLEYFYDQPRFFDQTPKELGELARLLGVAPDFFYREQKIQTLSGGEKVKLQFAAILMAQPDILLLDEPSNDIDVETLEWLETFINSAKVPVIFVSHDETLIEHTANVIIHLEQIRRKTQARHTVVRTDYRTYIRERLGRMEHQEQKAKKERSEYEKQMERFCKIRQKAEHQQAVITRQDPFRAQLLKKKMHTVKSMGRRFERQKEDMTEMPEAEEAMFARFAGQIQIPNGKTILEVSLEELKVPEEERVLARNIRLRVQGPEKVCILGRNGMGKTTLIRKIAEELMERKDIRAAYMPQNYEELLELHKTPVEFLQRDFSKEEYSRIRTYLGSMKYTAEEMEHEIAALSGGQKAKLLFLKMSLDGNDVLVLDEPTRNFSPLSNPVIRNILKEFGGAIISVSHDRKYVEEVCSTVYRMTPEGLAKENSYFG